VTDGKIERIGIAKGGTLLRDLQKETIFKFPLGSFL